MPRRVLAALAAGLLVAACSSTHRTPPVTIPTTAVPAPTGPAAVISGPISGGKGTAYLADPQPPDLRAAGYVENEFFADGTASSFQPVGPTGDDGRWSARADTQAAYRTRIVVRRPSQAQRFNGTVVVEWLNVSSGVDADTDFVYTSSELLRDGYAWVGVSAQQIGISGGTPLVAVPNGVIPSGGLRAIDPPRYATLHHPGDAYALDIYSQIGRALRTPGAIDALGGLHAQRLIADGESQSAFELTTYIDAIEPTAHVYDAFFLHSRAGGAIPLSGGNFTAAFGNAVRIRNDLDVPVFLLETETDEMLLGYFNARQPDTSHLTLWDVAGASHADAFSAGVGITFIGCKTEVNEAPTHYVADAAIAALDRWARTGQAPAPVAPMAVSIVNGAPTVDRDHLGNAVGGLRTPAVDVPVATYSGIAGDKSNVLCVLFGNTQPFSKAMLAQLYPSKAAYLSAYAKALDGAIAAGHLLAADRAQILADAAKVSF